MEKLRLPSKKTAKRCIVNYTKMLFRTKGYDIPSKNIHSYVNATYATMMTALKDIKQISEAYKGDINVIFYYAGHGVPNESNHNAYLLPVDVDGAQTELCLPISKLYQELSMRIFFDMLYS